MTDTQRTALLDTKLMKRHRKLLNTDFNIVPDPAPGDALFNETGDWWHNAFLNMGGKGIGSYAQGYKEGADILATRFLKQYRGLDYLAYPIVFLYRHSLELRLKQAIVAGQQLLAAPVEFQEELLEKHKLHELWKIYRRILGKVDCWPPDPVQTLDAIEALVREFDEKDPEGINFRYPHSKKKRGRQPTLPKLTRLNIKNLQAIMHRLASFLERQIDGIDAVLDESAL